MRTPGQRSGMASHTEPSTRGQSGRRRWKWRPVVRQLHRDTGYLAVGLTLVYAVSGIAVNHIADWDPNFQHLEAQHQLTGIPVGDEAAVAFVADELGIDEAPNDVFAYSKDRIVANYEQRTLTINPSSGVVIEKGQSPRLLLRLMNWLHLNRGKKAWTYFADGYAIMLIVLALSGMFMLSGRRGLIGRGGILVAIGIALPLLYVHYSGGP